MSNIRIEFSIKWVLISACITAMVSSAIASDPPKDMSVYKNLISKAIGTQGQVLLPKLRERMLQELERPFAIGGKSHLLNPSSSELNSGWELFVDGKSVKAIMEFTVSDSILGPPQQITANIFAQVGNDFPKLVLEITPVGTAASTAELDKIRFNEKELREVGLKSADPRSASVEGTDSVRR